MRHHFRQSHAVMMAASPSAAEDVAALDRVLTRLATTDDQNLDKASTVRPRPCRLALYGLGLHAGLVCMQDWGSSSVPNNDNNNKCTKRLLTGSDSPSNHSLMCTRAPMGNVACHPIATCIVGNRTCAHTVHAWPATYVCVRIFQSTPAYCYMDSPDCMRMHADGATHPCLC